MKKIISSAGLMAFAGAVLLIGATGAFFTDTETSAGNVFTAGTLNLKIDSFGATYMDSVIPSSNWFAKDLVGEKFFDFPNVMPGEYGVRHLSLHNESSDESYVCFNKGAVSQDSLQEEIEVFAWRDSTPDLVYNPIFEQPMTPDPIKIKDLDNITYADNDEGPVLGPITSGPAATGHMSVAWCAGTMSVNHTSGAISCDGAGMTTQGGSYIADMIVYAEQVANNPTFQCS